MIELDGGSLDLDVLAAVVRPTGDPPALRLSESARQRVQAARAVIAGAVERGEVVYGVSTGFGDLANVRIPREKLLSLQERLLVSHAAGVGPPLPSEAVRGMLLLRANTLARGHSGVRPEVIDRLLALLAADALPAVPSRGSVGASGDLAPLAHLALPLIGRGRLSFPGTDVAAGSEAAPPRIELTARDGLARLGLEPLVLEPKEGLALINGTQAMTALLGLSVLAARRLVRVADLVGALSTDALRGTDTAFDPRIHALRPFVGQQASARNLRGLLAGSAIRESHRFDDVRVQDPYSVRCMPQVHGAVRDLLADVTAKLLVEMNAVTDNPLIFPETGEVLSGGNFHGEPMAFGADVLKIGLAELGSIAERRLEKLTNAAFSGLPPFLVRDAGVNSGFMIAQVTAAALASENKGLAHPASVDSIPTSADKEDHVSMGMGAALGLLQIVDHVETILALELLAAAQGIDLLRPLVSSPPLEALHAALRQRVAPWDEDREMAPDIASARDFLRGPVEAHLLALE